MKTDITSRVVSRFVVASVKSDMLRGGERKEIVDQIWDMYKSSYAKIGLSVSSPSGLLKYDVWEVFFDDDAPIAFNLYKTTSFGMKTGLLGSDGSPTGKSVIKAHIKNRYKRPGVYGEVSHAVERLSQGVPVVCAVNAPKVLGKPVTPDEDGVHYSRKLPGVGVVTKKLIGTPRGVPSGPPNSCPIPQDDSPIHPRQASVEEDDDLDLADHYSSQLTFE